ncbi:hypothetical protein ACH47C_17850 [Streptomyces rishiriensis]|uniref:hypothetical protein n=1 Tax=Streptomyces rishiriensis TaxID=68264 RepID=UPI0033EA032E
MKAVGRSALCLVRTDFGGQPSWALVGEGALATVRAARITTRDLEALPLDSGEVDEHVNQVMEALENYGAHLTATPGGAGWLHAQQVPARRLVGQLVRKLMALSTWEPFGEAPGCITPASYEGFVGVRPSSSREYRSYTVTWSGVAFVLGASAPHNPLRSAQLRNLPRARSDVGSGRAPSTWPRSEVVALSWSSRHAATLLPVLEALSREGARSLLLDLATDDAQRCIAPDEQGVSFGALPAGLFSISGTVDELHLPDDDRVVRVKQHTLRLARLVRLISVVLETAGGCTQPSWRSVVEVERRLDEVLTAARPHTVLVSNDTSPLGALAVHAAERHSLNTVHVQHGAWTAEAVAWPALHSRHIVVMGERDVPLAMTWARHPGAEVHVLGQPRFDCLTSLDRAAQRRYLTRLMASAHDRVPSRIMVWACQPFSHDRLRTQANQIAQGLRRADGDWGLVIAPHPAQGVGAFSSLFECDRGPLDDELPVAVADPQVGARGCLAGADALASAYSTCGIEAVLLQVPVLEIGPSGERTLGLAGHGLAHRCHSADDVTAALTALACPDELMAQPVPDAVCRRRGDSAAAIAGLILGPEGATPLDPVPADSSAADPAQPQGEGVPTQ